MAAVRHEFKNLDLLAGFQQDLERFRRRSSLSLEDYQKYSDKKLEIQEIKEYYFFRLGDCEVSLFRKLQAHRGERYKNLQTHPKDLNTLRKEAEKMKKDYYDDYDDYDDDDWTSRVPFPKKVVEVPSYKVGDLLTFSRDVTRPDCLQFLGKTVKVIEKKVERVRDGHVNTYYVMDVETGEILKTAGHTKTRFAHRFFTKITEKEIQKLTQQDVDKSLVAGTMNFKDLMKVCSIDEWEEHHDIAYFKTEELLEEERREAKNRTKLL